MPTRSGTLTLHMRLEVVLPDESPTMPARRIADLARAAEDLDYDTAWLPDHILPPDAYGAVFGGVYEPLVTIGHLSATTRRLRLGTSVLVVPLRDPFVLAKQVATLHHLSEGRIVLGVGVGWNEQEFQAVGAEYPRRGAITDDALDLLRHLFTGGAAPYRGRRYSFDIGVFEPVPAGGVPVMVGGNSDAALRRAARHGDSWQGLPTSPAVFAERVSALAALAGDRHVTPTLRIGWDGGSPVGRTVDDLLAYGEAGAEAVAVHFGDHEGFAPRMEELRTALDKAR